MRATITVISVLYCIYLQSTQVTAKNITINVWQHNLPSLKPKSSSRYFVNGTFMYSNCNDWRISNDGLVPSLGCEVTMESVDSTYSKTCSIVFKNVARFAPRVVALTWDKAALVWTSGQSFPYVPLNERVISVLHFLDDCKVYDARLTIPAGTSVVRAMAKYVPIVPYDDGSFDAIYQDMNGCEKDKMCKVTFNNTANVIGNAVPWLNFTSNGTVKVVAVVPGSPAKGHLVLDYGLESDTQLSHVDGQGHLTPLRKLKGVSLPSYSTAHNRLTLCQYTKLSSHIVKEITCEQLDLNNVTINNVTTTIAPFAFVPDETIMTTITTTTNPTWFVHSLQTGGFLYLQRTRVVKFSADGQKVGSIEIEGLDCKEEDLKMLMANVFERKDGKYCVSAMCFGVDRRGMKREVEFGITCFSDQDFS